MTYTPPSHSMPPNIARATARYVGLPDTVPVPTLSKPNSKGTVKLFVTVFVSSLLFIAGITFIGAMTLPALIAFAPFQDKYQPILPLSPDREDVFLNIDDIPAKELYPPLAAIDAPATGNMIRIPALDLNVPLVMSASLNDKDVLASLIDGAALYPNGILPGRLGNTFISAHSTGEPWKGKYRYAFLKLNDLQTGNIIHVDFDNTRYTYKMTNKDIVTPSPEFLVVSNRPVPTVTLMACWPLWSTSKRMLITAELTNITKLTPRPILAAL